jgi:large subunit ribosomal protein L31
MGGSYLHTAIVYGILSRQCALKQERSMKSDIHPNYVNATVVCGCGNTFQTRSTRKELRVEICSACHPFYTGQQKIIDTAGRVERFNQKYANFRREAKQ